MPYFDQASAWTGFWIDFYGETSFFTFILDDIICFIHFKKINVRSNAYMSLDKPVRSGSGVGVNLRLLQKTKFVQETNLIDDRLITFVWIFL